MKNVGLCGGSSIYELGAISDMRCFFDCIDAVSIQNIACSIITEDLYRKYIKCKDLNKSLTVMNKIKEIFMSVDAQDIPFIAEASQINESNNEVVNQNLGVIFDKYFYSFEYCVESAIGFYEDWKIYKPVMVIVTDMPQYLLDKKIPLEKYDALGKDDSPFWMRSAL